MSATPSTADQAAASREAPEKGQIGATPDRATPAPAPSKAALWGGRVLSGLGALFMGFDAVGKLVQPVEVVEGTRSWGIRPA